MSTPSAPTEEVAPVVNPQLSLDSTILSPYFLLHPAILGRSFRSSRPLLAAIKLTNFCLLLVLANLTLSRFDFTSAL